MENAEEINKFLDSLPAFPKPFYEWSEDEKKFYTFRGNVEKYEDRMRFKLYSLWFLYGQLMTNPQIDKLIQNKPADESTDEYLVKSTLVQVIDSVAKILTTTDLFEELFLSVDHSKEIRTDLT